MMMKYGTMGVGYTEYSETNFPKTASFGAWYTETITTTVYSVDDFESLLNEYLDTLNTKNLQSALDTANANLTSAKAKASSANDALTAAKTAVTNAKTALTNAKQAKSDAQASLDAAHAAVSEKQMAYDAAVKNAEEAKAAYATASQIAESAHEKLESAEKDVQGWKDFHAMQEESVRINEERYEEAKADLAKKQAAVEKLRENSSAEVTRLKKVVEDAEAALAAAKDKAASAAQTVTDAKTAVSLAESAVSSAEQTLDEDSGTQDGTAEPHGRRGCPRCSAGGSRRAECEVQGYHFHGRKLQGSKCEDSRSEAGGC